jgi:photosystem II stability/assembly factor-like uncharacterized protein
LKTFSKKNIIYLVILLFTVYQKIDFAQDNWERLNSPTTENLNAVHFVDSLYGWAAGFSGTIIHTTNGGSDWVIQDSKTDNNIEDIYFIDRNLGWAVYWEVFNFPIGTFVLHTTDGGDNWLSSDFPQENIFSKCILFLDSLNGWMGGKPYPIVRTTNGGNTWTEAEIDSSGFSNLPVYDIQFYNSKYGYASGGIIDCCGITWWTTNGGDYWQVIDTPYVAQEPIYQLYLYDSLNVLGVGGDFEPLGFGVGMIQTTDGGGSWNFDYIGIRGVAWDIDFRNDYEAWAPLGGEQKLIYSLDSGLTWTSISTPDSAVIFKIIFPDSLHGFGVGLDGAIIKYRPTLSSVENENSFLADGFLLQQNYPNPFNPTTKIKFSIPFLEAGDCTFVQIKVYDILGNVVATLVNGELREGSYEINFYAGTLSSGVYFYTLSASGFVSSKKMILLR